MHFFLGALRVNYTWLKLSTCQQVPGRAAQLVTCLTANVCLTADPVIASSTPARSNTFVEIDYEIISMTIFLPSADSRRVVVRYKRKYVHEELVINRLVKLAQEKKCDQVELTIPP